MASGPYSRVYLSIGEDPMFERVFHNNNALATWLRMLLIADAMYPVSPEMSSRNPTVRLLIDCGLVIEEPFNRYSVRGLKAEREHRSDIGRNAAAVRYQSKRSANPLLDETRRDKKSISDANASTNGSRGNGWSQGYEALPGEAVVPRHEGQHPDCIVCEPMRSQT